jgi:hypothetical protein
MALPNKNLRKKFASKKADAKRKGIPFEITYDYFEALCIRTKVCPVLGLELEYNSGHGKGLQPNLASIDRIDSEKGYVPGNIGILSYAANAFKQQFTKVELAQLILKAQPWATITLAEAK